MTTLSTLLPVLERAECGSARLDLLIAYVVDEASSDDLRRIELFAEEAYVSDRISALLGYVPRPYTSTLDATVPGENIVLAMRSTGKESWAAIHRASDGEEFLRWGRTEPLARRIAALHAIAAATESATATTDTKDAEVAASDNGKAHPTTPSNAQVSPATGPAASPRQDELAENGDPEPWKILF